MTNGLVSIVTPCYNGENLIYRLLDSVLNQDYPLIEMIVVDDGSTDNTRFVVEGYVKLFESKGYKLIYIYQDNAGQAAAINKALPIVEGEYLIWPDSDDFFSSHDALSKMVCGIENLDNTYGYIRCWAKFVTEDSLDIVSIREFSVDSENLFDAFLYGTESHAAAGTYMFRMKAFDHVNPTRTIYEGCKPQNCQLLLPMAYRYKCKTIEEPLFSIRLRNDSHSRIKKTYNQQLSTIDGYWSIHEETLKSMDLPEVELDKFKEVCFNKLNLQRLDLALEYECSNDAVFYLTLLKKHHYPISEGKRLKVFLLSLSPKCLRTINRAKCYFKKVRNVLSKD